MNTDELTTEEWPAVGTRLWHRADRVNEQRALNGLPWITRCGLPRTTLRRHRPASDDFDVCVVCIEAEHQERGVA